MQTVVKHGYSHFCNNTPSLIQLYLKHKYKNQLFRRQSYIVFTDNLIKIILYNNLF